MSGKGFVALKLDSVQGKEIQKIFKTAGIKCLTPAKFHVTLVYDESDPEIDLPSNTKVYNAEIVGVERLGKKGSKYEAIALILRSPEIEKRHKELKKAGFNHKHPSFKCHMSVVYQPGETDEDIIDLIYKLGVLPKTLKFGKEYMGTTK
ncbi:hypothetical protein SEPL_284 [Salmonella phage SE_PL]|uniref:hypothetical protein n=1 Tax=Salmonella enterica TaxID=28901 RepID=UPI000FDFA117|nr:hypothetical protein CPT_Munch_141 [Salmonella phage Munch]EAZ2022932.1 hypothetical protein [Salmonella enterica]ECV9084066.1 hypothetical protein [Salmonella enterica subsp. enterica serovar Infantis]MCP0435832.1 hypothetical protein [Salmonella enterica subsp. enterica serovar Mbandaka]QCW18821.1 hypothetical protein 7t3_0300 [Salmonella phage 7t3]QIG62897.1 hypothetical protein SEPL_284 [Salmonella phage SE_PL]WNV47248.1 hypothetical protein [Klebsiella phage fENko-Kae01]